VGRRAVGGAVSACHGGRTSVGLCRPPACYRFVEQPGGRSVGSLAGGRGGGGAPTGLARPPGRPDPIRRGRAAASRGNQGLGVVVGSMSATDPSCRAPGRLSCHRRLRRAAPPQPGGPLGGVDSGTAGGYTPSPPRFSRAAGLPSGQIQVESFPDTDRVTRGPCAERRAESDRRGHPSRGAERVRLPDRCRTARPVPVGPGRGGVRRPRPPTRADRPVRLPAGSRESGGRR
jgi:hypothetical protein